MLTHWCCQNSFRF